jgi:indole-3-glycerol phosphate synthase
MMLDEILAHKRREIEALRAAPPPAPARAKARRDFAAALRGGPPVRLIAEVKRASPSRGLLRADFDPAALARAYQEAGAAAISVLTDERFFQGHLDHLAVVRRAAALPVLRKDFIVDEIQIPQSVAAGADAILLIAAALLAEKLRALRLRAAEAGLASLVEVHDEVDLDRALESGAEIIGLNNRDLGDFSVSLAVTERLRPRIPAGRLVVSESGVQERSDVLRLQEAGVDAILVGEALVRAPDPAVKLRELLGRK